MTVLQQAVLDNKIHLGPQTWLEAMKEDALIQIAATGYAEIELNGMKVTVDYR